MTEPYRADLLAGQHVLITGGGTGLGASLAARCADLGAAISICGRRRAPLDETVATLREAGGRAEGIPCDVREPDAVEALVSEAEQRQGPVTRLINNAAGNFLAFSHTLDSRGFDAVVDINLRGGFHATRACGRRWIERKSGGGVITITTTYTESGSPFIMPSATTKAALVAMSRSLAVEWGPHDIRLNCIAPGPIYTKGAWDRLMPGADFEKELLAGVPLGRFATREDLGQLAVYLLSDELSGTLTGQVVDLAGGARWAGHGSFSQLMRVPTEQLEQAFAALRPRAPKEREG